MITLGHGSVGSNRLAEAKAFYDALLGSAGVTTLFEHPSGGRVYGKFSSLANSDLHEGRDLPTSTDFRSVVGSIISQNFELSHKQMGTIFPSFNNSSRDNPLANKATL